jgi:hypothetical protein
MRTQAERAPALLLASGLPHFLWEEAMNHSNWLQNRTLAHALNEKTPYEVKNKRKPNLSGIQEFGAAAYVKDLKAGKLDARAKKGRFVRYDSESKGYKIYWPDKRSISVERNIVFNNDDVQLADDTTIIHAKVQSEGERDKVIQASKNNAKNTEEPKDDNPEDQQTQENEPKPHQTPKSPNSASLPSINDQDKPSQKPNDDDQSGQLWSRSKVQTSQRRF